MTSFTYAILGQLLTQLVYRHVTISEVENVSLINANAPNIKVSNKRINVCEKADIKYMCWIKIVRNIPVNTYMYISLHFHTFLAEPKERKTMTELSAHLRRLT